MTVSFAVNLSVARHVVVGLSHFSFLFRPSFFLSVINVLPILSPPKLEFFVSFSCLSLVSLSPFVRKSAAPLVRYCLVSLSLPLASAFFRREI